MSKGITLSPKYGVNPTIPSCFWCGELKNEIAFMGRISGNNHRQDIEAPKGVILDYVPCEECQKKFEQGVLLIEATPVPMHEGQPPMQEGAYPTGRHVVMTVEGAERCFPTLKGRKRAFVDTQIMNDLLGVGKNE